MELLLGFAILFVGLILTIWLVGFTFKLIGILLAGLVVGGLARLVLPGKQDLTLLQTAVYGAGGALVGRIFGYLLHVSGMWELVLSVGSAAAIVTLLGRNGGTNQ